MRGRGINRCGQEVIEDQDVDVVEVLDELQPYGVIGLQDCQFGGEHVGAVEPCGVVVAACCCDQGLGEVGFAD